MVIPGACNNANLIDDNGTTHLLHLYKREPIVTTKTIQVVFCCLKKRNTRRYTGSTIASIDILNCVYDKTRLIILKR